MNCVGGMLEGDVSSRLEAMGSREIALVPRIYDQGDFDPKSRENERERGSQKISTVDPRVYTQPSPTLRILPTRAFWVIKGKEKKLIMFLYISVLFLYNTTSSICYLLTRYIIDIFDKELRCHQTQE